MNNASSIVTISVDVPCEWFFYWFFDVDVPSIMHSYGIIPGVVRVSDQSGPMHLVGSSRVIHFTDGSTAFEEILSSDPPFQVNYRLFKLTNMFRYLVREGRAQVTIQPSQTGGSTVEYCYTFYGHNKATTLLLKPLVSIFMRGYLQTALSRAKQLAEAEVLGGLS